MSSRASRPRPASSRSRRQRLAAGAVLATTSLLGTYLAAIRPQPTYASPNTGGTVGVGSRPTVAPQSIGTMAIPTCDEAHVIVSTEGDLQNAITSSRDDSVICVRGRITLTDDLPRLDDTTVTFVGDDSVSSVIDGATYYSGLVSYPGGPGDDTLTVSSLGFSNLREGASRNDGGAIFIGLDGTLVVNDCAFDGNSVSDEGGAIRMDDRGTLAVTGSTFSENIAETYGGAISMDPDGTLTITNSTFYKNVNVDGDGDGGAIYMDNRGTLTVSSSTFDRNEAKDEGGSLYLDPDGTLTVTSTTFTGNTAGSHGGAIGGDVDGFVYSSRFTGNTAGGDGGAIDIDYIKGESLYFKDDTAAGSGGAIYVDGSGSTITSSTFKSNTAGVKGGGIYFDGTGTVIASTFTANRADEYGGGVYFWGRAGVYSSMFRDNYAVDSGGGARFWQEGTVVDTVFQGNDTGVAGLGGGAFIGGDLGLSSIARSSFIGNGADTAPMIGGGLYFDGAGSLDVTNSTFIGNRAKQGGGIYIAANSNFDDTISYTTIINNTATGGTPPSSGGGIFADDTLALLNSIVSGNSATLFFDARLNSTYGDIQNNLFTSAATTNNAGANAAFGAPLLDPVGNNGGPLIGDDSLHYLPTAIPAWNSPAVGLADPDLTSITETQIGTNRAGNVAGSMNASAAPPTPPPVFPPSAPPNVTGNAGDASATITWTAPASAGSFPITDYQAVLSPGGASCLVQAPALSCTITGLTNGTTYTATARALNGAGWGAFSAASEPFTPDNPTPPVTKTIVITGTRGTVGGKPGVYADGETTGLIGATVQARVKLAGQLEYGDGSTRIVQPDGTFRWQRKTGKKVYVYFIADDGAVRSNRIIIAAR